MKHILFLLLFNIIIFADNLDELLTEYTKETQLHKETKKEAAGYVILYTREDLDRMQAYTLNDVLNTIKMFSLQSSRAGGTSVSFATSNVSTIVPIRLFINNHELNNVTFGNPIAQYGAMNLFFIDYIEVYQAGNSINFGNESGSMVIRLYTKKPEYENATYAEVTIDSKASKQLNILSAQSIDNRYSYLLNIDINDRNMDKQNINSYKLSRDYTIAHLFFQFNKKDDYTIDVGATLGHKNTFASFSLSPTKDDQDGANIYIHVDKTFDNDIVLRASASIEKIFVDYADGAGVMLSDSTMAKEIKAEAQTTSMNLAIEKKFTSDNNELLIATKIKQNSGESIYFKADGIKKDMINGPTSYNIYSIYAEDLYNLNDNNLLTFGLKYNYFTNNFSSKTDTSFLYRIGYISHYNSFTNKIFIFNRVNQPSMGQISFSPVKIKPNVDLEPFKINIVSATSTYNFSKNTVADIGLAIAEVEDAIGINPIDKQFINISKTIHFSRAFLRFKHNFDFDNRLTIDWFKVFKDKSFSPSSGFSLQIFNKIGNFDIYNELVYRESYTNEIGKELDAGFDYTLAIAYPVSRQSIIKLKGENIFDTASEVYIYDNPMQEGIYEPARQQRVLASWEYEF